MNGVLLLDILYGVTRSGQAVTGDGRGKEGHEFEERNLTLTLIRIPYHHM